MKEISGKVFSIATENIPIRGCTISKAVSSKTDFPFLIFHYPRTRI